MVIRQRQQRPPRAGRMAWPASLFVVMGEGFSSCGLMLALREAVCRRAVMASPSVTDVCPFQLDGSTRAAKFENWVPLKIEHALPAAAPSHALRQARAAHCARGRADERACGRADECSRLGRRSAPRMRATAPRRHRDRRRGHARRARRRLRRARPAAAGGQGARRRAWLASALGFKCRARGEGHARRRHRASNRARRESDARRRRAAWAQASHMTAHTTASYVDILLWRYTTKKHQAVPTSAIASL
mmetsp:Transcript_10686/g.33690  ORF Transcript_10686/g.33690 Transcript_10686/m.33690 type:complete len:247 (+) Transcript_10686:763-1503(+)